MSERVVFKYAVGQPTKTGRVWVDLPSESVPLSVGLQDGQMVVWVLVDPENDRDELFPHRLIVANTGTTVPGFPDGARFLGTLTSSNGTVWHVFDGDAETTA